MGLAGITLFHYYYFVICFNGNGIGSPVQPEVLNFYMVLEKNVFVDYPSYKIISQLI